MMSTEREDDRPDGEPSPDQRPLDIEAELGRAHRRIAELQATNERLRDRLVEVTIEQARNGEGLDDFVPLKRALGYAPGFHPERARKLCASGAVVARQKGKGSPWFPSLSSFLAAVRQRLG